MVLWYQITLGVLALIIVGLVGYIAYLLLKRSPWTRDKFAFVALWANLGVLPILIPSLLGPEPVWVVVFNMVSEIFGLEYRVPQAGVVDKLLCFALYVFFLHWSGSVFRHWNGAVSQRQSEQEKRKEQASLMWEGFCETRRLVKRLPGSPLAGKDDVPFEKLFAPTAPLPWRHRAAELVCLRRPSFRLDLETGWHEAHDVWIGHNVHTDALVGVLCVREVRDDVLDGVIAYCRRLAEERDVEILIATQAAPLGEWAREGVVLDIQTEDQLLDGLVDFEDYFNAVEARVEHRPLPDSALTLSDVYVPSQLRSRDGTIVSEDLSDYLSGWAAETGDRHLAVLGGYGQGKSTGALMFTYRTIQRLRAGEAPRIPVFLELRGKSPSTLTPLELMSAWASLYGIDPRAMMRLLEAGRLVVILDGFDEMASAGTSEERVAHFASLWRLCGPGSKLIFTGRPHFLLDDREIKMALGIEKGVAAGPYCEALEIGLFDPERIERSLRRFPTVTRDEITALAVQDERFRDIVARPSLLYAVAQMWGGPDLSGTVKNITSGSVLSLFVRHSYRRQSEKLRQGQNFMPLGENERAYFMMGIAAHMARQGLPNQISRIAFQDVVRRLFQEMPEMAPVQSLAVGGPSPRPLKLRMEDDPDRLEKIITDIRTYGILESDPSRPDTLRFAHKSFFEVLFAEYLALPILGKDDLQQRSIFVATKAAADDVRKVSDALRMCAELIIAEKKWGCFTDPFFLMKKIFGNLFFILWPVAVIELFLFRVVNSKKRTNSLIYTGFFVSVVGFYGLFKINEYIKFNLNQKTYSEGFIFYNFTIAASVVFLIWAFALSIYKIFALENGANSLSSLFYFRVKLLFLCRECAGIPAENFRLSLKLDPPSADEMASYLEWNR